MALLYHRTRESLRDMWNIISGRLSLQYGYSITRKHERQWQTLMKFGCYYALVLHSLYYYQHRHKYTFLSILLLSIVVVPFIIVSRRNPANYGQYCVPVISIINMITLDLLSDNISLGMLCSFIFFSLLLHAKLWINGNTMTNILFAPLLHIHILISTELCIQYIRHSLYHCLILSSVLLILHFINIFNGHLHGSKNDLLFFISSVWFINLQNMVHIASSSYFVIHHDDVVILFILCALYIGIVCVFGIAYEFTILILPPWSKACAPYISCIVLGFGFENILIIFYWFDVYYIDDTYAAYCFVYWLVFSLPCISSFLGLWFVQLHITDHKTSLDRGKARWNPHIQFIWQGYDQYPQPMQHIMVDRIYSIIHNAQCTNSSFGGLFSMNEDAMPVQSVHRSFDCVCLRNQRLYVELHDEPIAHKLVFMTGMLEKIFGQKHKRKYVPYIAIVIVMKVIAYMIVFVRWPQWIAIEERMGCHMFHFSTWLWIIRCFMIVHICNIMIVCYYEYYFSFIWSISIRDTSRLVQFYQQLNRNRVIWQMIKPQGIASIIIKFLEYDS
eukprot:751435_1